MNKQKILNQLKQNQNFKTQEEVFAFEEAVWDLVSLQGTHSFPALISYLDDDSDYIEVMQSIVNSFSHVISSAENQQEYDCYVQAIIENCAYLWEQSLDATEQIFYGILNSDQCLTALKKILNQSNEIKEMDSILKHICDDSPKHKDLCNKLLAMNQKKQNKDKFPDLYQKGK
jgi:hypothetical protein